MELDDESLRGSFKVIETSSTLKVKPHFVGGVEHRFVRDIIKKVWADEPIMKFIETRNNEWTTSREIIDGTGMAERTVHHMCNRLVLHGALELKYARVMDTQNYLRKTRLYRLKVKGKNGSSRNRKRNKTSKSNVEKIK